MTHRIALVLAAALTACAAPPNTPGAGEGKDYTPIIDLAGVNGDKYLADLTACRNSAAMIDADRQQLMGFLGGAILGAAIGASFGGDSRTIDSGASAGGLSGGVAAGAKARSRQAIVMGNCMASRGYRVIDGTASIVYTAAPQAAPAPAAAAAPQAQPAGAPPAPTSTPMDPEVRPIKAVAPPSGSDGFAAERLARKLNCNGSVSMIGKGPGYETYNATCAGTEAIVIRCEFGNCRELR